MKHIAKVKTAVFLLLLLCGSVLAVGQMTTPTCMGPKATGTQTQSTGTAAKSTYGTRPASWDSKTPGVTILRLWENIGPRSPEVAILRLSDAEYQEFRNDRRTFLIKYDVFRTDKLKAVIAASELVPAFKAYKDPPGDDMWMVMVEHDWSACNSATAAVQLFPSKP